MLPPLAALWIAAVAIDPPVLRIRVVDAATGQSCPGAVVFVLDRNHRDKAPIRDLFVDEIDRAAAHGFRLVADRDGIATLPPLEPFSVVAHVGTMAGALVGPLPARLSPYVLPVVEAAPVALRIVDGAGRPSTVPIACLGRIGEFAHSQVMVRVDAVTGVGALRLAALRPPLRPLPVFPEPWRGDEDGIVDLFVDVVGQERRVGEIDLIAPPKELRLVVPDHGSLLIRGREADGRPIRSGQLHVRAEGERTHRHVAGSPGYAQLVDGVASIPAVALGLQLRVQIQGESGVPHHFTMAGPTRSGQAVEQEFTVPASPEAAAAIDLTVRLHLPDGGAAAGRLVTLAILRAAAAPPAYAPSGTTDAAGRLALRWHGEVLPGDELLLVTASGGTFSPMDHLARRPLRAGRLDLGTVVLQAAPLLCSGVVVDEHGEPLTATVEPFVLGQPKAALELPGTHQVTDVLGGFRFHALTATGPRFSLQARSPVAEPMALAAMAAKDVPFGAKALRLVVPRGHEVTGKVVLDRGVPPGRITVQCMRSDRYGVPGCGLDKLDDSREVVVDADGTFAIPGVASGKYHIAFRLRGAFELALLENVDIDGGRVVAPAETQAVDLRGKLRPVVVVVSVAGGGDLPAGDLQLRPVAGAMAFPQLRQAQVPTALRQRPLRLWVPDGEFELAVASPTHQAAPAKVTDAAMRIELTAK